VDHQAKVNKIAADLDELLRNVQARLTELKKQPDSPEQRAEKDELKNALVGLQRSLDSLLATLTRDRSRS
jgi:hypothetical protein